MEQSFLKFTVDSLTASYIPSPRFLMEDALAGLSNNAKALYALLLDRASISKVNGFLETDGTIRLYFTVKQAQKKLHRSRQSTTCIFRELRLRITKRRHSKTGWQSREKAFCFIMSLIFDFIDQNKKSEPMSNRIKVRIISLWSCPTPCSPPGRGAASYG